MEKTVIGLVAALGVAAPFAATSAAAMTVDEANGALRASSVAELLEPAPVNAVAVLDALDAAPEAPAATEKGVQLAQWHHHHHHHWGWGHHHHYWGWGHHHHNWYWRHRRWCAYHPYAAGCY